MGDIPFNPLYRGKFGQITHSVQNATDNQSVGNQTSFSVDGVVHDVLHSVFSLICTLAGCPAHKWSSSLRRDTLSSMGSKSYFCANDP